MPERRSLPKTLGPLACAALLAAAGCPARPAGQQPRAPLAPPASPPARLTVLYTTDMHSRIDPETRDGVTAGGILALAAQVQRVRSEQEHVLLLDSGDVLSGHPVSTLEVDGVPGGAMFQFMNLLGYDALELGNHDFDNGQEALSSLVRMARFPVLCANVVREDGSLATPEVRRSIILTAGGVRVGVFGLMLEQLPQVTARRCTEGLRVLPPVEVARELVSQLDPETDFIVALTHQGRDPNAALAEATPGLDLILGGHEHVLLDPPERVRDTLICQAGSSMRTLGRLDIVVAADAIASYEHAFLPLPPPQDPGLAGAEVASLLSSVMARLEAEMAVPLGELATPWRRNYHGESNVGNWVAAVFADAASAPIGFVNSGSLRRDLDAGPMTVGDMLQVVPFQNTLAEMTVTGAELRAICRHNAIAAATEDHGILQVSGVAYSWRRMPDGVVEILSISTGGAGVADEHDYRCIAPEFVVFDQAEKYLGFVPQRRAMLGLPVQEVLLAAARRQGTIDARTDGRIRRVE